MAPALKQSTASVVEPQPVSTITVGGIVRECPHRGGCHLPLGESTTRDASLSSEKCFGPSTSQSNTDTAENRLPAVASVSMIKGARSAGNSASWPDRNHHVFGVGHTGGQDGQINHPAR